jgi:hypothetical protein
MAFSVCLISLFVNKISPFYHLLSVINCFKVIAFSFLFGLGIDIKSLKNRLLKVYVLATSAGLPKLFFFAVTIVSSKKANKAGGTRH